MAGKYNSYSEGRAANITDPSTGINTGEWYDRQLLETAWEKFIISNFTAKKTAPKYEGDGVVFSRYEQLDTFATPLAEGTNPPGQALEKTNVRTKVNTYGSYVELTDDLLIYGEDSARIKRDVVDNLGSAAGQTQEGLIITAIEGDATDIVFDTDLDNTLKTAELALRNALASKFTSMITGSTKYSTTPIRPAYAGFVSPEGALKLEDELVGYVPVEKYGYSDGLLPNEVGSYRGIRFCETTLMPYSGAGKLQALILGEEAVAEVGIRGIKKVETIIKDLGEAAADDFLNRKSSIGAKFKVGTCVLRSDWCVRVDLEA
jgi:N4-gp56 family major capsid protein